MKKFILLMVLVATTLTAFAEQLNHDMFNVTSKDNVFNIRTLTPDHYYPAAGIKITSSGYEITSGCSKIANGYCLFGVSDTQLANVSFSGSAAELDFNLCLDGKGPLSCQKFSHARKKLYVTNLYEQGANGVDVCSVASDGSISNCVPAGNTVNDFDGAASISINADNTMAYVVNYNGVSISVCPINPDGTFKNCIQNISFVFSYGGSAISPNGKTLFVTNYDTQTVDACAINEDGTLGACVDTGAGSSFGCPSSPYAIILNKAGNTAYVAQLTEDNNHVAVCAVSGTTFTCADSGAADALPIGLAFSEDESQVYVGNTLLAPPYVYPSIQVCDVGSGGSLSCLDAGYSGGTPWGILIDAANARAYVSNIFNNSIMVCEINSESGQFNSCIDSGIVNTFNGPALMTFSN